MKYTISWKIKMPDRVGGYWLEGCTNRYGINMAAAIADFKEELLLFWPKDSIQVFGPNEAIYKDAKPIRLLNIKQS